jgi:UDP:flavonoid glycosyltransferase YjiC (YdhE family)
MRMLFTANPMYGHVNTVLPLARAARAGGHDVAFATGPDLVAQAQRAGLVTWPVGPTHREAGGGADADWMEYFAVSAQKRADDLVPRARRWRPDLVVSEETELAVPSWPRPPARDRPSTDWASCRRPGSGTPSPAW